MLMFVVDLWKQWQLKKEAVIGSNFMKNGASFTYNKITIHKKLLTMGDPKAVHFKAWYNGTCHKNYPWGST